MAIVRFTRFTADPSDTDELLARRADLIGAVRSRFPGLTATRLARLDDGTWVDTWQWESAAALQAVTDAVAGLPEAAAAFALTTAPTAEQAELVDER